MAKRCKVTFMKSYESRGGVDRFIGWSALLWSGKRVVNARNYPRTTKTLSAAEKRRARASLCAGLAELGGARRRR